jgi:hypothetical protein
MKPANVALFPSVSGGANTAAPPGTAQPHSGGVIERPIRFADGAYIEVVCLSAQRAVQLVHQLCGLLPRSCSDGQRVDRVHRMLDALLRWPVRQARLAGSRRIHSSERVTQKVELSFRYLTDACLLLVDRKLSACP